MQNMHDVFTLVTSTRVIINSDVNEATSVSYINYNNYLVYQDTFQLYFIVIYNR